MSEIDELSQVIRQVDGDHTMGAGRLAEEIVGSDWHAAELRRAKAEAWREGHDAGWTAHYNGDDFSVYRNPYRADQIEKEAA